MVSAERDGISTTRNFSEFKLYIPSGMDERVVSKEGEEQTATEQQPNQLEKERSGEPSLGPPMDTATPNAPATTIVPSTTEGLPLCQAEAPKRGRPTREVSFAKKAHLEIERKAYDEARAADPKIRKSSRLRP